MNYIFYSWLVCVLIFSVYIIYICKDQFSSFFNFSKKEECGFTDPLQKIVDSHEQHLKAHKEALGIKEEVVTLDFNTGKITLPENFTSLESFLKENDASGRGKDLRVKKLSPFTTANELHDNQLQVREEMENHKFDTEHWSDEDFIENLLSYHNQQYKFDGLVQMYHKLNERGELSQDEKKKIREWYVLVSQELVYDV